MTLVGIGHQARVGKDTSADALCRLLNFRKARFSANVKALAMEANPIVVPAIRVTNVDAGKGRLAHTVRSLGGLEMAKDTIPEVRTFLQQLGNGARRVFGDDFWVEQAFHNLDLHEHVVFCDVRYRNEAEAIKKRGGFLLKVNRPGYGGLDSHISEVDLLDYTGWDATIVNSGSIQDLEDRIVETVQAWQAREVPAKA